MLINYLIFISERSFFQDLQTNLAEASTHHERIFPTKHPLEMSEHNFNVIMRKVKVQKGVEKLKENSILSFNSICIFGKIEISTPPTRVAKTERNI